MLVQEHVEVGRRLACRKGALGGVAELLPFRGS